MVAEFHQEQTLFLNYFIKLQSRNRRNTFFAFFSQKVRPSFSILFKKLFVAKYLFKSLHWSSFAFLCASGQNR